MIGRLAVLVVHQPVAALLHALGSTPITPYSPSSNPALGHSGVPVVELLGRDLDDPDRWDVGSSAARLDLLDRCSLSWLRLPTGIFYKQGVKANVLFLGKKRVSAEPNTKELWIYDLRTNQRFTLKERPMVRADLDDFVACYKSGRRHERAETERFRRFGHAALVARDKINLDIFWLKDDTLDDPDLLPPPDEIAAEIVENLEAALDRFRKAALSLQPG